MLEGAVCFADGGVDAMMRAGLYRLRGLMMEKILYLLWRRHEDTAADFRRRLLADIAPGLLRSTGVQHVRLNVADDDVAPAAALRQSCSGQPFDAMLSLWVDTAVWRARCESVFREQVARWHAYLVCESEPIVHAARMPLDGGRVEGWSQICILTRPDWISYEQWLAVWQNSHTQIAIDTQSTFGYRQNVIVRPLSYAAPGYSAIIEENFPAAAMTSQQAFYAAEGDEERYRANLRAMMDSCARFIDRDRIDVVPTSEYNWGPATRAGS